MDKLIASLVLLASNCCIAAVVHDDSKLIHAHIQLALNALMTGEITLLEVDQDEWDQALSTAAGSKDYENLLKDAKQADPVELNERVNNAIRSARKAYPQVSDLAINAFLRQPGGRLREEFQVSLTGKSLGKPRFFQMTFDSLRTSNGWIGHSKFQFHQTIGIDTVRQLEEEREFFKELYWQERMNSIVRVKGRISCNYGNRGGTCEIENSLVTYSFSLSEKNDVDWYFEDVKLPTTKLQDTDIVIPTFERQALTHFQDCSADVTTNGHRLTVRIRLKGCAHSKEIYEPALNPSVED